MSKNQKHKEEVDRVFDIFKAMNEAVPEKSTREDVIDAAELIIVDAIMQTKVRGLRLAGFQLKVLDDIRKLCDAFREKERMMEASDMNDLFNEYVQALNKALALRKQLVRERMERVLNENEPNKVSKDIVNEIADGANNTFARVIERYEQYELFDGWEHTLKDGQFIAK